MTERREPLTLEDYKAIGEAAEYVAQHYREQYQRAIVKHQAFRDATFKVLLKIVGLARRSTG